MATTMRDIINQLSDDSLTDEQVAHYALDYIKAGMSSEERDYLRSWLIYSRPDASIMVEEAVSQVIRHNPYEPTFQQFRELYNQATAAAKNPSARDKLVSALVGLWAIMSSSFAQELTERDHLDLDRLPNAIGNELFSSAFSQCKLLIELSCMVPLLAENQERFQA